ncbi:glycerophosphodiester phosphodiesterase family protein [Hyphomicrobium sp. LHD-15]|uniref:glycerophosphodiester phosphodiesterase family protein n=1 Tax=Hyphomicrobium sp. LHD-15 TaxID=3072142 RepID=UPI00280E2EE0|nr:glycerophosphodiester phosphodiesterase family protein [Hyphomicrobium sp. LHD-15]MDQ8699713.1 glycerophosphodiester phosphodiesterase family protein [Hyphomicrobium sp. LHD-15]
MLDREKFLRPIAHRGLHDAAKGLIENTAPAFEAAIKAGYGIECDLQPAADGTPLVFHDLELDRLTAGTGLITELQPACAAKLPFKDTKLTGILTFAELLTLVAGRVPIFAEIKSEWAPPDLGFLSEIARAGKLYRRPLALMSFDPAVVAAIKRLAPELPRGIVSGSYFDDDGKGWWPDSALTDARRQALASLLESGQADPSFYAYEVGALPTAATQRARRQGIPLLTWTVRTEQDRRIAAQHADAPIFEGFTP